MSLLEHATIKKRRMDDENNKAELDTDNKSREYKVEAIRDSVVYARESELGHLPGLYYLVWWKRYLEEENTLEPASAVQHLRKLISLFYKDHPNKPIATFSAIDTASPMARLTIKPAEPPQQKQRRLANSTKIRVKKWAAFDFYRVFGWIWVTCKFDDLRRIVLTARDIQPIVSVNSFYFLTPSSLNHKASVFLLELPLGQEIFHQQPSLLQ